MDGFGRRQAGPLKRHDGRNGPMKIYSRICAIVFGLMMTALCVVIAVETVLRKLLNHSLAGVDELSGYAIAIGAPLCFAVTAVERSHIRINLLHMRMPERLQAMLNLVSALSLAATYSSSE